MNKAGVNLLPGSGIFVVKKNCYSRKLELTTYAILAVCSAVVSLKIGLDVVSVSGFPGVALTTAPTASKHIGALLAFLASGLSAVYFVLIWLETYFYKRLIKFAKEDGVIKAVDVF